MSLFNETDARKTVSPRSAGSGPPIHNITEVRANTIWRFLQDRGYINTDHTLSPWGRALQKALKYAAESPDMSSAERRVEMEEAILLAFELLRLDVLGTQQMFPVPPYTGAPMRGTDGDKQKALLISRIACLGNLQHREIGYTGPLSRNLLAYQQITAAVRGALRDLLEMHACYMLLSGAVDRKQKPGAYTDLAASLPFVNEPNLGMSLLVKRYVTFSDGQRQLDIPHDMCFP